MAATAPLQRRATPLSPPVRLLPARIARALLLALLMSVGIAAAARAQQSAVIPDSLRLPGIDPWDREVVWLAPEPERAPRSTSTSADTGEAFLEASTSTASASWFSLEPRIVLPSARMTHSAIFDPVNQTMVVFGGSAAGYKNDTWVLTLGTVPEWTQLSGTPPSARRLHTAIYDPVRERMLVYGGYNGSFFADVWALSLSGTPTWTQLSPLGPIPPARAGHVAVYDPVGDRMVVFGGYDGVSSPSLRRNDVWELSLSGTPTWTQLTPAGPAPSARSSPTAVYDEARGRMVMFGGTDPAFLGEVWELSLTGSPAWTQLSAPGGPAPREGHSAIYDPAHDRMVAFGGYDQSHDYSDTWSLDFTTLQWEHIQIYGFAAGPRWGQSTVYDSNRGWMALFGGFSGSNSMNDTYLLPLVEGEAWRSAVTPGQRLTHRAVDDPIRGRVAIFGGIWSGVMNDTWMLTLGTIPEWTEPVQNGTPPAPRRLHTAIYDPVRDRMLVYGGFDGAFFGDLWALSLSGIPTWTQIIPQGSIPQSRAGHVSVYDPIGDRMVVFGGYDGVSSPSLRRNDVWALSLSGTPTWSQLTPAGPAPSARSSATAVYDEMRGRMVVFAGTDPSYLGDVWALSLTGSPAWTQLGAPGGPTAREEHSAIYDPAHDRMVVFGGYDQNNLYGDTWVLDFTTLQWEAIAIVGAAPVPRWGHSAVYDQALQGMVLYGGAKANDVLWDTWLLLWDQPTPVAHSFVRADVQPGVARLTWQAAAGDLRAATVYRSVSEGSWDALDRVSPDGTGMIVYVDRTVEAGARYQYRLGLAGLEGESYFGEVTVDIPSTLALAVRTVPTAGRLVVSCSFPRAGRATLDVLDVGGRRAASRAFTVDRSGELIVDFGRETFPPGLYFVRLREAGATAMAKAALVH